MTRKYTTLTDRAYEHSQTINTDGVLVENGNLCLQDDGTEYIIPERNWKYFKMCGECFKCGNYFEELNQKQIKQVKDCGMFKCSSCMGEE